MNDAVRFSHQPSGGIAVKLENLLALAALVLAFAAALFALAPGPVYAAGVLELLPAFALLLDWAPGAAIAAGCLGLLALAVATKRRRWRAATGAVAACLLGGVVWLSVADFKARAAANPLHDVTTDLDAPPLFQAISPRSYRAGDDDTMAAYPDATWRRTHAEIYPDIRPVIVSGSMSEVLAHTRSIAGRMGWTIVAEEGDAALMRIEASDETAWFGFTDDIVVVLRIVVPPGEAESGVRVDVRSVSRIGIGDVGKNAERVRAFLGRLSSG